jgi:signal peptidase
VNGRRLAWNVARGAALVALAALVAGSLLGQPVLLGYVETGSMAPTLEAGDGFVALPTAVAGPVEEGDVVVYEARQLNGGGLTTHRVVGQTENGFVTKGDANPFTDQDGTEPPVTRGQIRAVALQVGGQVLVIPELGTAATAVTGLLGAVDRTVAGALGGIGAQAFGLVVLGVGLVLYGLEALDGGGRERADPGDRSRDGRDPRIFLLLLTLVMVAPVTAAMAVPSGPSEIAVVSAETDSPAPQVIRQGTTEDRNYRLRNGGVIPVVTYLEPTSEGIDPSPRRTVLPGRTTVNATLAVSAPPDTGYYVRSVSEHRYLLALPVAVIDPLHTVHPWLPIVAIDLLYGGGFYLLGLTLVGSGRVRRRADGKGGRLRRRLRRLVG